MSITEKYIQNKFVEQFGGVVVPNCGAYGWESDLLRVTENRWVHEYEIKCTREDLVRDRAKKYKHQKLDLYSGGTRPNSFSYVLSSPDIKWDDINKNYGIIVSTGDRFVVMRKPKTLHRQPADDRTLNYVLRGLSVRLWQELSRK